MESVLLFQYPIVNQDGRQIDIQKICHQIYWREPGQIIDGLDASRIEQGEVAQVCLNRVIVCRRLRGICQVYFGVFKLTGLVGVASLERANFKDILE